MKIGNIFLATLLFSFQSAAALHHFESLIISITCLCVCLCGCVHVSAGAWEGIGPPGVGTGSCELHSMYSYPPSRFLVLHSIVLLLHRVLES